MSTVISVRVKKEIKEELEKAGINIAKEIKEFLENLAWQVRAKKEIEKINRILKEVKPSSVGFAQASVRKDRDTNL